MIRYRDWEYRLNEYLRSKVDEPFAWGSNDCAFFVGGGLEAMGGVKPTHWMEGKFKTKFGAFREAVKFGCESIEQAEMKVLDELLTRKEVEYKFEFGDIVMGYIKNLDPAVTGPTIGIASAGGKYIFVPGRDKLELAEVKRVVAIWK